MVVSKKRIFAILIITLVFIEFISVFLMWKSVSGRTTKLDNVDLKISTKNNDMFAIMLGDKNGVYKESTSNIWPTDGSYIYNSTKSGCIDKNGSTLDGVLSFDSSSYTARVKTNTMAYCYLYFDIDQVVPQAFTFYLGGSTNPTYTTKTSVSTYLSWSDTDISSYCVTTESTSDNCTWNSTSGTSVTGTYTLTAGDETKTVYAYLKDNAGNISEQVVDTIILDTTVPTISSVTKTSDVETSISVSVTASDTNGISKYYYSINSGSYTSSTSSTYTFSGLTKGTSYTIKVYVEDKAGNISTVTTKTFKTKIPTPISEYLMSTPTTGLTTTAQEGGLYRYQGTSANNYICFGTSDKSTCTGNTDAYMYRIIGINSSNQLKLIKKESLNSTREWHSSSSSDYPWKSSALYTNLNGSTFLTNTTYVPEGWSDKIATTTWKYGKITTYNATADEIYTIESAYTSTISAKIGLMYMHDYLYGLSGGNNCSSSGAYSTCKTSWLHLSNNDSGAPSSDEWTMSYYGFYNNSYYAAYYVNSSGSISTRSLYNAHSLRPVFYLASDVSIVSGSGTSSDPFIIG